jgi:BMFP domain-containing protein YqiC
METPRIDEIARRLLESVPPGLRAMQQDLESNFRAVLRSSLTKLDLVSRDEFEAQTRVLERTRARLEELERRVAQMEGTPPARAEGLGTSTGAMSAGSPGKRGPAGG